MLPNKPTIPIFDPATTEAFATKHGWALHTAVTPLGVSEFTFEPT